MKIESVPDIWFPGLGRRSACLLRGDTHAGKWVRAQGRIDHDQYPLKFILALRGAGGVIWDVGAMIGAYSCAFAMSARFVLALEARLDAYHCLKTNVAEYPNVSPVMAVVGDGTSALIDSTDELNAGARRVLPTSEDPRRNSKAHWSIRLDDLLAEEKAPTLIKMDIEGWEVKALRGAEIILRDIRPTLVLEVNQEALRAAGDSTIALQEILDKNDYEATDLITKERWHYLDTNPQTDIVAVPRGVDRCNT